jgi:hypothetical protein
MAWDKFKLPRHIPNISTSDLRITSFPLEFLLLECPSVHMTDRPKPSLEGDIF